MSKSYQCQVHNLKGKNKYGQCPVCATDTVLLKELQSEDAIKKRHPLMMKVVNLDKWPPAHQQNWKKQ